MSFIEETELAGIGRRFEIVTDSGSHLIIVVHDSGPVELFKADPGDPEKTVAIATLTDDEARLVAAIIGKTIYRPEAVERLDRHGVTIAWHTLKANSYAVGKTVGELLHDTGVVVLAVIERDGKKQTGPTPQYVLPESSQVALAGTRRNIQKVKEMMEKGR